MTTEVTQVTATDTTQGGEQAGSTESTTTPTDGTLPVTDPTKAPETKVEDVKYEFKLPEGMELDAALAAEFTTIAKDLKLTPEAAQKLVDLRSAAEAKRAELHKTTIAKWADDVKADKELGGDKLAESTATAKKAIALGGPELTALLNESGLGNHPVIFKWAHAIGKAMSEDSKVITGSGTADQKTMADRLYGAPPAKP